MIDETYFKKNKDVKNESFLKKILFNLIIKVLFVVIIFLASLIYIRQSKKNKDYVKSIVYTNNLSFAKIYNIYERYLGDVIPFKNIFEENKKLVSDEVMSYNNVTESDNGYIFDVSNNYSVLSLSSGIVLKVEKDKNYKTKITIQDEDGTNITYGFLSDINVKLYDYVEKNEIIGECNKALYISFEKDGKYIKYEKYL